MSAIGAFFQAATAFLKVWPLFYLSKLENQIDEIDREIYMLGFVGSTSSGLRIDKLGEKKQRIVESVRAIRSAIRHPD